MNNEEIKELLAKLPQSAFSALKKDFERTQRVKEYLKHHENIPLTSQIDKRITAPFSKGKQLVALKRCPICEIFTTLEAMQEHLEVKHSLTSRNAESINEKLKILYKEPIIWNEPKAPTKLYRTLTSKGKIQCCEIFRSPENHEMHLKKHHPSSDSPSCPKGQPHKTSKHRSAMKEKYDLSKLAPEELLKLIKMIQQTQ